MKKDRKKEKKEEKTLLYSNFWIHIYPSLYTYLFLGSFYFFNNGFGFFCLFVNGGSFLG